MNFMKWMPLYFAFSAIVLAVGIFSMVRWGFKFSIGFTGGSLLEVRFQQATPELTTIETALKDIYRLDSVITSPSNSSVIIKGASMDDPTFVLVKQALEPLGTFELIRFDIILA